MAACLLSFLSSPQEEKEEGGQAGNQTSGPLQEGQGPPGWAIARGCSWGSLLLWRAQEGPQGSAESQPGTRPAACTLVLALRPASKTHQSGAPHWLRLGALGKDTHPEWKTGSVLPGPMGSGPPGRMVPGAQQGLFLGAALNRRKRLAIKRCSTEH